jgi:hypothetical protein
MVRTCAEMALLPSLHCTGCAARIAGWGQNITWDFMQTVSHWFLGVFKLFLWFPFLAALWLTLWARQLRKLDRQVPR